MHAGQLHIDAVVVQRLLRVQFPQWKDLPVEEVRTTGTVNALFSIGKGLVARFPLVGQDPGRRSGVVVGRGRGGARVREGVHRPHFRAGGDR